jgi:hypothetical protein
MTNNTITIEAGDLVDFTFKIQQAILDGYRLSDQGDMAPQNIGWVFVTTMIKAEDVPVSQLSVTINVDTEQAVAQIQELANHVGEVDDDSAAQIVAQAMTVEPNIVEPKTTQQRRGRQSK